MIKSKKKLTLKQESIATLTMNHMHEVMGGNRTIESIVYWCPGNTSIQRSCSSCTTGTCP